MRFVWIVEEWHNKFGHWLPLVVEFKFWDKDTGTNRITPKKTYKYETRNTVKAKEILEYYERKGLEVRMRKVKE